MGALLECLSVYTLTPKGQMAQGSLCRSEGIVKGVKARSWTPGGEMARVGTRAGLSPLCYENI